MTYLILILVPLALLSVFLMVVAVEERSNRRMFSRKRYELDMKVERASFVLMHVDWGAFVNDVIRAAFERTLHDIAHGSLIIVRFLERELTSVVRTLRSRREHPAITAPRDAPPSRLDAALTYMRKSVRRSRKELPTPREEGSGE